MGLEVEAVHDVIEVVIDRGDDRNLLTLGMCHELLGYLRSPPEGAHVLRLRARGPAFCLGRERDAEDAEALRGEASTLVALNQALRSSPLVTFAEVRGDAAGFGVGLVALADVAVAGTGARFWFPEVRIDLAPAVVLSWLPGIVGHKRAFWMTATGDPIAAADAATLGLVTAVVPDEEVTATSDAMVAALRQREPRVHRAIKDYLAVTADMAPSAAAALATERLVIGSMQRRRTGEHDG